MKARQLIFLAGLFGAVGAVFAHGDESTAKKAPAAVKKEQKEWGIAGDATAAKRTIRIRMLDSMRFSPNRVEVKLGETIRFTHKNDGKIMHEFVIGGRKDLDEHAALMVKFPNMEHDEPYMAHVGPGKRGEVIWTFNRVGEFDFACLIPGHYQAGMKGKIIVSAK